jgi:serine/threonine protein kinase
VTDPFDHLKSALEDRYAIEREIGRGGMATVFLAEDVRHSRKVAVKVLKPELAESVGADRFLREIRTTANLRHPHIVPLYDSGQAAGFLYYVMPFVEGESLEQRLERERQLSVDESLKIAGQVADALSYAHERGLLHRDIKPGNVMLERGHAVVTDFGVARAVSAAGGERLTSTGLAVGTPAYMSPEQAAGDDRLDARRPASFHGHDRFCGDGSSRAGSRASAGHGATRATGARVRDRREGSRQDSSGPIPVDGRVGSGPGHRSGGWVPSAISARRSR